MKNKIKDDRILAIKSKNNIEKTILTTLLGELDRKSKSPSNGDVISTIKKIMDSNLEINSEISIQENKILSKYMPKVLTNTEIDLIIENQIKENNFTNIKDMGKIMKFFTENHTGEYNGKIVSNLVKNRLLNEK